LSNGLIKLFYRLSNVIDRQTDYKSQLEVLSDGLLKVDACSPNVLSDKTVLLSHSINCSSRWNN